jgi:hypothetical protein
VPEDRRKAATLDVAAFFAERTASLAETLGDDADEGAGDAELARQREELEKLSPDELIPIFPTTYEFQSRGKYVVLVVVDCEPWKVPACIQFGGWNNAPYPHVQSAVLRHWGQLYGAALVVVGGDYLELRTRLTLTPTQLKALAWEQFIFAEDIALQGTETVAKLAKGIAISPWFLWWD